MTELTLTKLLFNEPDTIKIPPFGEIKVRLPTNGERIKAYNSVKSREDWNSLPQDEKDAEWMAELIPYILVEPKITSDELNNKIPTPHRNALIEIIMAWILKKDAELRKERKGVFDTFFQDLKEK